MNEVFDGKIMAGAKFTNVWLENAVFDDVNLQGAAFANVYLRGATFRDINFQDVVIEDSSIGGLVINGHDIAALIAAEEVRRK